MAEHDDERPRRRSRPRDEDAPTPRRRPAPRRARSRDDAEEPPPRERRRFALDDEELVGPRRLSGPPSERRSGRDRREGGWEPVLHALRELPHFGMLLYRLARDPRVSGLDKALVAAAVAYVAIPDDYIPDALPFVGELDDVLVITLALGRLVNNAGPELLYEHWDGAPESLDAALGLLQRAADLLPGRLRGLLGGAG